MTDREPDDLYDALRDRLADYGQEPPAPLWAGIRAQLPPPVAGPQKRRRRWAPLVLLLLVLAAASGLGWHRWLTPPPLAGTGPGMPVATQKNENLTRNISPKTQPTASSPATSYQPNTRPQPATATAVVAAEASASSPSDGATGSAIAEPKIHSKPASTQATKASSALATKSGSADTSSAVRSGLLAGVSERVAGRRIGGRMLNETAEPQISTVASTPAAGQAANGFSKLLRERKAVAYSTKKRATSARTASAARPGAAAITAESEARRPHPNAIKGRLSARLSTKSAVVYEADKLESSKADALGSPLMAAGLARQAALAVSVQLAAGLGLGTPQLVAIVPNVPPAALGPHWAVQVLAGPAFTYRQLGASPLNSAISNPLYKGVSSVAELERPALASGAQVSIRRSFAGPWSLSAGLGYAEFATGLALQQVKLAGGSSDSITGIHRRDTYRFVTLPVRLGYAWTLANRWQVGVLAGVDAALYVGGTSTEGSACACQTQTWGPTGSPYRSLSLGLSLGGEVRYRLNGRWELLAQPTATYLLTPLARPTAGYYQRRLFGGTALLGAAYILP